MKNILLNGLLLNDNYAGVQYSIEYFIEALSACESDDFKFTVLVSSEYKGKLKQTSNLSLYRVRFKSSNRLRRIFFENFGLPQFFRQNKFDLYHSTGYTLPYFADIPSIVTIHDLIALDFPELCQNETTLYFSAVLPNAIHKANKIITVSNTVKSDILNRYPQIEEHKIEVIYHGLHPRFKKVKDIDACLAVKAKYNLSDKYLFFVGNIEPKKNLAIIIKAFDELKEQYNIEHKLVIAGRKGWKYSPIFATANESKWTLDISFIDYVDEEDLPYLYSMAEMLLFPSLYEGFGLPVIEAMACGCPVIVSDRGALPEISGGHCPMVDPYDKSELASCILNIITDADYKDRLVDQGHIRSRSFTWQDAASKALKVYEIMV